MDDEEEEDDVDERMRSPFLSKLESIASSAVRAADKVCARAVFFFLWPIWVSCGACWRTAAVQGLMVASVIRHD